ncbi:SWR1 complex subunit 2 isoform X1 [Beta vulgaris subsp. vulgaris]|uniref:SWR1 complex subunit 2 isoform X1 n=1 Tax=Beta vulgaris subsp. vulgaris TaxID=3555 RepID=UPI0020373BB9|nr:SWR1 complex subunit 2 isoform X1 [Beta vulgaris subsp. vulgaris]
MEPSNEENPGFLDRTSRATRGKRMNKLLDEEAEEDEAFWNQEALKDEEDDNEYEAEPEVVDEFDSDFDEDEPEADDGAENEADAREKRPKKRLTYPGKPVTKKKKKDLSKLEKSLKDEMEKDVSKNVETPDEEKLSEQPTTPDHQEEGDEVEGEKSVRKSTRTAVIVRQAEREAIRAALQATMKPIKRKKEGEEKRMTQEEMLLEAAQTEIRNLRHLERVLAREEEVKKRAIVHKAAFTGPQIQYFSKNGHSYIEFRNGVSFESEISTKSVPYPQKAVCAITGLPAKYRDPKTGLPYATKEAFQMIRERYAAENSRSGGKMAVGELYNSIMGQGFLGRRQRSPISRQSETPYPRSSRRFCRIPAVDYVVSD